MTTTSRTIVVTGAANGIGKAVTEQLRAAGDTVIGVDLRDSDINADLGTPGGRQDVVRQVQERTDVLHGLVLNAGISSGGTKMISVNHFGVTELAQGLRPLLEKSGAGRVSITSSASGTTGLVADEVVAACLSGDETAALAAGAAAEERMHLYASSKRALTIWMRRTSIEPGWADHDILVNAVAPGVVVTGLNTDLLNNEEGRRLVEEAMPVQVARGYMAAEEVAKLHVFLISPDNNHITGQLIHIDGGVDVAHRGADVFHGLERAGH